MRVFVEDNFSDFRLESGGSEYSLPCPFHGDKPGDRHLYANFDSGLWVCFRCEEKGNFFQLVRRMALDDHSIEAKEYLQGLDDVPDGTGDLVKLGVAVEEEVSIPPPTATPLVPPTGTVPAWEKQDSTIIELRRRRGFEYVLSRGVAPAAIEFYGVRVGIAGKYEGRVLIPVIHPILQQPVGWIARAYLPLLAPKVLNTPSVGGRSIDECPFNLDKAIGLYKDVVLVEGVFDAMKHGPRFLSLQGKTLTSGQRNTIVKARFDAVTVLLDQDAKRESRVLARSLRLFFDRVYWAVILDAKDPNEASREQVEAALAARTRV
jgi:DNA primase